MFSTLWAPAEVLNNKTTTLLCMYSTSKMYFMFKLYTHRHVQVHTGISPPHTQTHALTLRPVSDVTFSTCRLAFNYRPVSGPSSPVAARPWASLSSLCPVYIPLHPPHRERCPAYSSAHVLVTARHTFDISSTKSVTAVSNGYPRSYAESYPSTG